MVDVPLEQLTDRQLHIHHIELFQQQVGVLTRLEKFMSDLTTSVASLQGAVDNMAVRFASQIVPLTEALAQAQSDLDAAEGLNEETTAALQDSLNNAQAAADAINAEVAELNSIGAAPDVPVEPVPVEELPAPPSEETPTEE